MRPFVSAVHGTKSNDLLQLDYIELGPSTGGNKYALMLHDDHWDFNRLFAFPYTVAENAIIEWCAAFGAPRSFMFDGPTHFKNETMRLVSKGLTTAHQFTLPYCPWSNEAVESLGRELLRIFRSVLSELQLNQTEWTDLLPIVQSVLNNSPSPQRENIFPIKAFTGSDPSTPMSTFERTETSTTVTIYDVQRESAFNTDGFIARRNELHPVVANSLLKNREYNRKAAAPGVLPNFTERDLVLVAPSGFGVGEKLSLCWRGPRRVVKAINDFVDQI